MSLMGGIPLGVVFLAFSDTECPELEASFQDAASDLEVGRIYPELSQPIPYGLFAKLAPETKQVTLAKDGVDRVFDRSCCKWNVGVDRQVDGLCRRVLPRISRAMLDEVTLNPLN